MHAKTPNDLHLPPPIVEVVLSSCLSIFCFSLKKFHPVDFSIGSEKKYPKFDFFILTINELITVRFNNKLIEFCSKQNSFLIVLRILVRPY